MLMELKEIDLMEQTPPSPPGQRAYDVREGRAVNQWNRESFLEMEVDFSRKGRNLKLHNLNT